MAEQVKVSMSQAIRDYLKSARPSERGPKAVCEALKSKGINVSQSLVSQVKNSINKKKNKNKKRLLEMARSGKARPKSKKTTDFSSSFDTWILAKNLLNSVDGDLVQAKKNLEIMSKLLS